MELRHIAVREGRLSTFLQRELKLSTGLINRLKWQGAIFVNGKPEWNNFSVQAGDVITVLLDEPEPEYPPEDGEFRIVYEDEHILAADKPAGMLIHPSRAQNSGTFANRAAGYYERTGQKCAFHPVTRLDRDTFGIVLLAKNAHVHSLLNDLHAKGQLRKTYHALTFGCPPESSGVIDLPIARRPLPSLLRCISPEGKPSVTEYRILEQCGSITRLELRPVTGRTHQLRLHCAHLGFPILGDPQYGSEASQLFSEQLGLQGQQLCAHTLEFCHPMTGQQMCIYSGMDVSLPRFEL